MMKSNISIIVAELLELEPSLKGKEKEITKIVKQLLESKPDIQIDMQFKNELRYMLKQQIQAGSFPVASHKNTWLQGVWYAIGGAVMASLILTPGFYFYYSPQQSAFINAVPQMKQESSSFMMMDTKNQLSANSNQQLVGDQEEDISIMNEGSLEEDIPMEKAMTRSFMPVEPGIGGSGGLPLDREGKRFAMPQSYQLSYAGEGFTIEGEERNIYKRSNSVEIVDSKKLVEALNIPQVNIGALDGDLQLDSLIFFENKKYGYGIQVSQEGEVTIQQNWRTWPDPYASCSDSACYDQQQMKLSDVPSDEKIIAMAQELLDRFSIDVSKYGKPEISNEWRRNQGEEILYVPDSLTVTYPEVLEGKNVYDQNGEKAGIKVNVNIRYKKAASVWGISVHNFRSESVVIMQDANAFIKKAEGGGVNVYVPEYAQEEVERVAIHQPEEVYVKLWDFDSNTKIGTNVYVPALRFELGDHPQNIGLYQNNVFVPLVEKYWNKQGGYPELMREGH